MEATLDAECMEEKAPALARKQGGLGASRLRGEMASTRLQRKRNALNDIQNAGNSKRG
jgi:hypothetical protein